MSQFTKAVIEKASDGEFTAVASTSTVDRHGEIVDALGWDLKNFKNDPVILWGHNHSEPAIGKASRVWIDKTGKNPVLKFKAVLSEATQRAREIKQLMEEGIIKTFSVGFRPIESDGNKFTKQELLEISAVNVPANPDAQMLAYKSLKKAGFNEEEMQEIGINTDLAETIGKMQQELDIVKAKADAAVKGLESLNPLKGRDQRLVEDRLSIAKVAVRAADHIVYGRHSKADRERMAKIVKRANEKLIVSFKKELNGTNKRT